MPGVRVAVETDSERPATLRCSSCGAPIFWALSSSGKRIPLNAEPYNVMANGHYAVEWPNGPNAAPLAIHRPAIHVTHFATCPNASSHRRRPAGSSSPRP